MLLIRSLASNPQWTNKSTKYKSPSKLINDNNMEKSTLTKEKIDIQPGCDVIKVEINLIFQIKPFSLHDQNVKTKI